jgi:transposase
LQGKPGPKRKLEAYDAWVRAEVQRQPDATLAELCERLAKTKGVQAHPSLMWRALQHLALPLKKVTARQSARYATRATLTPNVSEKDSRSAPADRRTTKIHR